MSSVNEHYLDRVVALSDTATVEATEDIVSGSGLKLVAKGVRIDGRLRERLLEHKLRKPLEAMLRVVDGVASRPMDQVAESLLASHPLLARLCGPRTARIVARGLHDLRLSTPLESMLTVYARQGEGHLAHAVGVALMAAALGHDVPAPGPAGLNTLLVAGLLHDVGDLYIDPAILRADAGLTPAQWRHIAAHPVIGGRVLAELPGAGARVAQAVLHHHERLDGFGYPQNLAGPALDAGGQALALAEVLMGLSERHVDPGPRARVALQLVPGEFARPFVDRVTRAAAAGPEAAPPAAPAPSQEPGPLAERAAQISSAFVRMQGLGLEASCLVGASNPALSALAGRLIERCRRLNMAWSSTGLDALPATALQAHLAAVEPGPALETALVIDELRWRLGELQREMQERAAALAPQLDATQAPLLQSLLDGLAALPEAAVAQSSPAAPAGITAP